MSLCKLWGVFRIRYHACAIYLKVDPTMALLEDADYPDAKGHFTAQSLGLTPLIFSGSERAVS